MTELPVLDIAGFRRDPESAEGRAFVEDLGTACSGPGFCHLIDHGVAPDIVRDVASVARAFFRLPEADRREIEIRNSPRFRGYTILGDERTGGLSDWRDQLDFGVEEELPDLAPDDPPWMGLRGPNQWPRQLPAMKQIVTAWMAAMERLGLSVARALALGLGQPIDHFDRYLLPRGDARAKLVRYPAQQPKTQTGQGVGLHQDAGFLTFIEQDDVGGLQVMSEGRMVDVEPLPGAFVMNLGEMMQAATGGYLRATRHRVASPPAGRERLSMAFFYNTGFGATLEPIHLPPHLAARGFTPPPVDPDNPIFNTFGENHLKIRLRAHPDVAKAHYAHLLDSNLVAR